MGVVTVKSTSITNRDASPMVANTSAYGAGYRERRIDDFASVAATDSSTSKYLLVRIPSNAIVKDIWLEWGALGGACAADLGLYYADDARECGQGITAGAVIDADFFASAIAMATAGGPTNETNESGTYTTALRFKPIWEAAGLSSDPGGKLDIVATLTADAASASRIYANVGYAEVN